MTAGPSSPPPTEIDAEARPLISVIVVAYNEARAIGECMGSLAAQQFDGLVEHFLVDGSSDDETVAVAQQKLPDLRIVRNPRRAISTGRELGWRCARAPLIAFLDADCVAPPDWLHNLYAAQKRLAADAVGGSNRPPPSESRFYDALAIALDSYLGSYHSVQGRRYKRERAVEHLPGLNVLYRREALDAVGGYDPRFAFMGEDADLSWKLCKQGKRLYYVPDAEVIHRQRPGYFLWAQRMFRYGRGRASLIRKHCAVDGWPPALHFLAPLVAPFFPAVHLPLITLYGIYRGLLVGRPQLSFEIALLLALTHLGYGIGEWVGLLERDSGAFPSS